MDLKRLFFIIPLAVLAYLMVIQWNQDYHGQQQPTDTPAFSEQSSDAAPSEQGLDAPDSSAERASQPDDQAMADSGSGAGQQDNSSLISVATDVLQVRIDPRGGDIVYAALPQHKQQLHGDRPFVLLSDDQRRSYIARSGLQLGDHAGRIRFNAERQSYTLGDDQQNLTVDLHGSINGVDVIKRFTFDRNSYAVKVSYLLDNGSQSPVSARFIGQLARDGSPDPTSGAGVGMHSYLGAAFSTPEDHYRKVDFDDIRNGNFANQDARGGWVAMIQHYFTTAWVPGGDQQNLYYTDTDSRDRNVAAFAGPTRDIAPGNSGELSATLYMGPKVQERLEAVAPNLNLTVDFGWLWFLASPLFWLLKHIHALIGNWGWSIILLTCLVKAALFPLSAKAYKSMARMRKLGPEMKRIKEQHGDDRQKMSQEMMKFYQQEKINPLGGCLPMVIQMPVFIALYWMLMESVELRHAPFILWIHDLSAQDPYFILPIIMGLSMFAQQLLNPTPPDPTQAKIMKMLPIIFTFFFLWFPAGLVLYWITNNCLSIAQQYFVTRRIERTMDARGSEKGSGS
ncbi:protein translocase subunit yidC [Kushneria sinocarnis]|uniref:Membrane protein insertase YidC n=1 Tax=Kushneria sinocarnis TaxID=595502 RepID=A0A420X0L6_9GAMM|nr:membrane protein insertase YidC [Kushneria sinocarnis]RKR07297.1 protein translocase subunit yidC [Kushneria sinocarnis]